MMMKHYSKMPIMYFLGTKPHDFENLANRIREHITNDNRFISIMAGLSIDYIRQQLNTNNPLARIMPNTNAQVGHSVTGISFSNNFDPKSKNEVDELINAFGSVIEVSEEHLHQVTAITGSGPAFLYHVFEQYVKSRYRIRFRTKSSRRIYTQFNYWNK